MKEQHEILNELNSNPFKMPDGYLESLESSIHEKINPEKPVKKGWAPVLKPVLFMAAMFGIIFGMGYGVMALTHTEKAQDNLFSGTDLLTEDKAPISEEDIINYLTDAISYNQLETYLAQE